MQRPLVGRYVYPAGIDVDIQNTRSMYINLLGVAILPPIYTEVCTLQPACIYSQRCSINEGFYTGHLAIAPHQFEPKQTIEIYK